MESHAVSVSERELALIKEILRSVLEDQKVFAFGSRARGDCRQTSDLDLAVEGAGLLPISKRAALEFAFSESDLPFRVDIVDLATIDEHFRRMIQPECIAIDYRDC